MKRSSLFGTALLAAIGCGSTPDATAERSSGSAVTRTPSSASASALPSAAASTSLPPSPCDDLRKAVVDEAAKIGSCKVDDDCKVHRVVACGWPELDCYATHIDKSKSTADLDAAMGSYAKSCPLSKCKCEMPEKSVCKSGRCARP